MIEFKLVQCRFVSEQWDSVGELLCGLQQIRHPGHSLPHHVQTNIKKESFEELQYFLPKFWDSIIITLQIGCSNFPN